MGQFWIGIDTDTHCTISLWWCNKPFHWRLESRVWMKASSSCQSAPKICHSELISIFDWVHESMHEMMLIWTRMVQTITIALVIDDYFNWRFLVVVMERDQRMQTDLNAKSSDDIGALFWAANSLETSVTSQWCYGAIDCRKHDQ